MKKQLITLFLLLGCFSLMAQERMYVHHLGNVMYNESIDNIDSIKFRNQNSIFNTTGGIFELPISDIDSITFGNDPAPIDSIIYIVFSETAATIINPFSENGVSINVAGNHVTAVSNANLEHLKYHLSGTTANGSLSLTSDLPCSLFFDNLNITNPNGPVVDILSDKASEIVLIDNTINVMVDGSASIKKAVIQSVGNLTLSGNGTVNITANKRNGIYSDN